MKASAKAGFLLGAVFLVLLLADARFVQAAAEADQWVPIFDFELEVDGKRSPEARFFVEARGPLLVVSDPNLASAAIIDRSTRVVTSVDKNKVDVDLNADTVTIADGVTVDQPTTPCQDGQPGCFTINAAEVVFYLGKNRLKILPKNPLVGPATLDEILAHSPVYRRGIEVYEPEEGPVATIRSIQDPLDIEVYFGTWCSHCKVLVPKFIKVMKVANNKNLRISWTGVPKTFNTYPPAQSKGVKGIPTFIFYRDGKEVGRIPGDPGNSSIEKAIADILRPSGE